MLRTSPKFSIVTVTYDCVRHTGGNFLEQCIQSVHNQTYKNIEHIVIDNASTDGTLDILNFYANKKWLKVFSKPDKGIYDAMNRGLKHAKGKYILYLNSDDFFADNQAIEKLVNKLESGNYDFACGACNVLDKNDMFKFTLFPKPQKIFYEMPFAHPSFAVKRAVLDKLGGFNTKFKIAGDYDFILRMAKRGACGIILNDILTNFREGGISTTQIGLTELETANCISKNLHVSKKTYNLFAQRGYISPSVLNKNIKNFRAPFDIKEIKQYNNTKLRHFWKRQLFTLHLGTEKCLRIFGITICNKKPKRD